MEVLLAGEHPYTQKPVCENKNAGKLVASLHLNENTPYTHYVIALPSLVFSAKKKSKSSLYF
jgi:hypothetical protein